jgi:hypothetical protein
MATPRVTTPGPEAGALVPGLPADVRAALAEIGGDQFAAAMAAHVWPLALDLLSDFASRPAPEQKRAWLERALEYFRSSEAQQLVALAYVVTLPLDLKLLIAATRRPTSASRYIRTSDSVIINECDLAGLRSWEYSTLNEADGDILNLLLMPIAHDRPSKDHYDRDDDYRAAYAQWLDGVEKWRATMPEVSGARWIAAITRALKHPGVSRPERKGPLAEAGEVCRAALPVFHATGVQPTARPVRLLGNAAAVSAGLRPLTLRHWQQALKAARLR